MCYCDDARLDRPVEKRATLLLPRFHMGKSGGSLVDKFYVYVHRKATDGSVFYVGKGSGSRLHSKASRSTFWHAIAKDSGFIPEMRSKLMSNACALSYEKALIHAIGFENLCNLTRGGNKGASGYKPDRAAVMARALRCRKPVINSDGKTYASLKEAALDMRKNGHLKATEAHISSCCKGKRHVAFGRSWSMDISSVPALIDSSKKVNEARRRFVFASNGKKFESVSAAAEWVRFTLRVKCGTSDISRCCSKKRKTCAGLEWNYV